ncbi:MAG: ATP-binding protein [Methanomassiliicoccaceae archaeon]|nr:ATP-binding protein [Methanomassiliicoccaceae archaeon]
MNGLKTKIIPRERYIGKIRPHIGKPYIKILKGVRRGGKSTILKMIAEEISAKDPDANIVFIDFELYSNAEIADADKLYRRVSGSVKEDVTNVLMIDEVQEVKGWEKVIASFYNEGVFDIYITGSNSRLLSSEFSTYISGRYVSFDIQTLSFSECLDFKKTIEEVFLGLFNIESLSFSERLDLRKIIENGASEEDIFGIMQHQGGFPVIWVSDYSDSDAYAVIRDIYSSIVLRDIVQKHGLRNDVALKRMVAFLCDNIANPTSLNNIYEGLSREYGRMRKETVYKFCEYLEEAFIFYRVEEEGLKGKALLSPKYKFYLSDLGIKNALLGYRSDDISKHLENIVFLEMKSRGYDITIGNVNGNEVDFVCKRDNSRIYIQVAYRLSSERTIEREFGNLKMIQDGYPKYVVTMDPDWTAGDLDGIKFIHVKEFLKMKL